jgi:hypothetical protein
MSASIGTRPALRAGPPSFQALPQDVREHLAADRDQCYPSVIAWLLSVSSFERFTMTPWDQAVGMTSPVHSQLNSCKYRFHRSATCFDKLTLELVRVASFVRGQVFDRFFNLLCSERPVMFGIHPLSFI